MNTRLIFLLSVPLMLSACAAPGLLVGMGATGGIAAAQEGGISRALTDTRIQAEINDLWFQNNLKIFSQLDLTVNQGRVLITGVVQDPEHRVEAVRLAWQPKGVKQVINEIRVADSPGITGYARDAWITTRLRTTLTFDRSVQSINYSIDTVQGVVYLMGIAQNQMELNRVIETARTVPDVKQVVSYVKLAGVQDQDFVPENAVPVMDGAAPMSRDYNDPSAAMPNDSVDFGGAPQPLVRDDYSDPNDDMSGMSGGAYTPAPVSSEPLP